MKHLRILLIVAGFIFFAGCAMNGHINKTPSDQINAASILPDPSRLNAHKIISAVKSSGFVLDQNRALLAVTGLLFIWLLFRFHRASRPHKKQPTLGAEEIALLDLAADTLNDLRHRLASKKNQNHPVSKGRLKNGEMNHGHRCYTFHR